MTSHFLARIARPITRLLSAAAAAIAVASCGGGVSAPTSPIVASPILTILPGTAVMYPGLPTTFVFSGGTGAYIFSSSNQAVIQFTGGVNGGSVTLVANPVLVDTDVVLTLRDTGSATPVTATVTVKPGTLSNAITITPSSTQGGDCAPAICSGGDAEVTVTLSQGGIPLAARGVRFDAVSGDYNFILASQGGLESLAKSITAASDETGKARVRLRVTPGAANQTALLKVTDLATGSFQQTSFVIAQATGSSPGFFTIPSGVTFTGLRADQCARNASTTFYIFGGTPPYSVSNTGSAYFSITPTVVSAAGGSFTVVSSGACVDPGFPIGITDSTGRTITVTVANKPGTDAVPALVVAPEAIGLSDCDTIANVTVAGGTGNYLQPSSGSGSVIASIFGNTISVRRLNPSPATTSPVSIGISDGISVKTVTLTLTGRGLGACPSSGLTASPSAVTLSDCTSSTVVAVSGGSGTYTATSSSSSVVATVSGGTVTIRRADPSAAFAGGSVTVSDGTSSVVITVNSTGAGAGACPSTTPPTSLAANPSSVTLTDCSTIQNVTLSGGSGTYTAVSGNSSVTATVSGTNILSIRRANSSSAFAGGVVTVSDGTSSINVTVNATGAGAGICGTSPPGAITATPSVVQLTDCNIVQNVTVSGGSGTYTAVSGNGSVLATVSGNVVSIRRASPSAVITSSSVTVTVSDGSSSLPITVNVSGAGAGSCPSSGTLTANPTTVTLTDCATPRTVTLSGGSGSYSFTNSNPTAIAANISGTSLTIQRAVPSAAAFVGTIGTITVQDGGTSTPVQISVTANGAGAGACS